MNSPCSLAMSQIFPQASFHLRDTLTKAKCLCRSICHADPSRDNSQGPGAKFLSQGRDLSTAGDPGSMGFVRNQKTTSGWWLVSTPLKTLVNWDDEISNIWENNKCSKPSTRIRVWQNGFLSGFIMAIYSWMGLAHHWGSLVSRHSKNRWARRFTGHSTISASSMGGFPHGSPCFTSS